MTPIEHIGTIEITDDDVKDFIPDGAVHLWIVERGEYIGTICGEKDNEHNRCSGGIFPWGTDVSECPDCGAPVCNYCRLLNVKK